MNKEFIPYEQALALKELGFDEPCFGYYSNGEFVFGNYTNNIMQRFRYSSPTFSQAFRWFREKYQLAVDIRSEHLGYYTSIVDREKMMRIVMKPVNIFETYEEAEQACLDKLIEIVKTNETLH